MVEVRQRGARDRSADNVCSHLRNASRALGMLCLIQSDIKVFTTCYFPNVRPEGRRLVGKTPGKVLCVL